MANARDEVTQFNFSRGFITEASKLEFPADASVDELNFRLSMDGVRRRRFGVDFEEGHQTRVLRTVSGGELKNPKNVIKTHSWAGVNREADVNFIAVLSDTYVDFYQQEEPLSINQVEGDADRVRLSQLGFSENGRFNSVGGALLHDSPPSDGVVITPFDCSMTTGNGFMLLTGEGVEASLVTYDKENEGIQTQPLVLLERVFEDIRTRFPPEHTPVLTEAFLLELYTNPNLDAHIYNLMNRGWSWDDIEVYRTSNLIGELPRLPARSYVWHRAKLIDPDGRDKFDPKQLEALQFGASEAPRGSFLHPVTAKYLTDRAAARPFMVDVLSQYHMRPIGIDTALHNHTVPDSGILHMTVEYNDARRTLMIRAAIDQDTSGANRRFMTQLMAYTSINDIPMVANVTGLALGDETINQIMPCKVHAEVVDSETDPEAAFEFFFPMKVPAYANGLDEWQQLIVEDEESPIVIYPYPDKPLSGGRTLEPLPWTHVNPFWASGSVVGPDGRSLAEPTDPADDAVVRDRRRVKTATFAFGRAFWGNSDYYKAGSKVYFSQVVLENDDVAKCYTEADPTNEFVSDPIDSDGGVIHIPEMADIVSMATIGNSVLVFSSSGTWEITGDLESGAFSAVNPNVIKRNSLINVAPEGVVEAEGAVVAAADEGIFVYTLDGESGAVTFNSITAETIDAFYKKIPTSSKRLIQAAYDSKEKKVYFVYPHNEHGITTLMNHILVLDTRLGAFSKYEVPLEPYGIASVFSVRAGVEGDKEDRVRFVCAGPHTIEDINLDNTLSDWGYTFGGFFNEEFKDWETGSGGEGADAAAFLETGFVNGEDIQRRKQVPYITVALNRTETGFEEHPEGGGGLVPLNPSSCIMQARWEWASSNAGGKFGTEQQVYRYRRNYIPMNANDSFDTGESLIITRNKLRGRGRSVHLYFRTEAEKDCQIVGWQHSISGGSTV